MAGTIVRRLLHQPTMRLKASADEDGTYAYVQALRELFGLDTEKLSAFEAPQSEIPAAGRQRRAGRRGDARSARAGSTGTAEAAAHRHTRERARARAGERGRRPRWRRGAPRSRSSRSRPAGTRARAAPGDKSRFVKEIEDALLAGEVDLAVHSAKDVPGRLPDGLTIAAVPRGRGPARRPRRASGPIDALPDGARVGTSSLRRRSQLLAINPRIDVVPLRGNVDTRLRKLADGEYDAMVLALAGLRRLGRDDEAGAALDADRFVPAPGQGLLALETRADDARGATVRALEDADARRRLEAERAVVGGAGCELPHAGRRARTHRRRAIAIHAFVGLPDGSEWITDRVEAVGRRPARPRVASWRAGCSRPVPETCCAGRRVRSAHERPRRRDRLPGRSRPRRSAPCDGARGRADRGGRRDPATTGSCPPALLEHARSRRRADLRRQAAGPAIDAAGGHQPPAGRARQRGAGRGPPEGRRPVRVRQGRRGGRGACRGGSALRGRAGRDGGRRRSRLRRHSGHAPRRGLRRRLRDGARGPRQAGVRARLGGAGRVPGHARLLHGRAGAARARRGADRARARVHRAGGGRGARHAARPAHRDRHAGADRGAGAGGRHQAAGGHGRGPGCRAARPPRMARARPAVRPPRGGHAGPGAGERAGRAPRGAGRRGRPGARDPDRATGRRRAGGHRRAGARAGATSCASRAPTAPSC